MKQEKSTNAVRLHAIIEGDVQGVGFRQFTLCCARRLRLHGWVRNRDDGAVEVLAEGERSSLDALVAVLHEGPPAATVRELTSDWLNATGEFVRFIIRY
jgi:acylphosphatase